MQRHFDAWQQEYHILTPSQITEEFYHRFVDYLYFERNLVTNTVGITIKELKVFCKWLTKQGGVNVSQDYEKFQVPKSDPNVVYLTHEEVSKYYNAMLPDYLSNQRDVWCFQANSGQRLGDLIRLNRIPVIDGIIHQRAHKNSREIFIPLNPMARAIYDKYDGQLPIISEQKYRDYVKQGMRKAGLDRPVEIVTHRGSKKEYSHPPIWQEVSSHTARKTFITHCMERNIEPKTVATIVGISLDVLMKHYYGTSKPHIKDEFLSKWK